MVSWDRVTRRHVLRRIQEYDRLGPEQFFSEHGFAATPTYELVWDKGHKAVYECVKAFSETDFTEDLMRFDVPTLVLHGDDDQIVPIGITSLISAKIIKGGPH